LNFRRLLIVLLSSIAARAVFGAAGSTGASFLELPFDPRAAALGGAATAITADGYSARVNPAGLAFLDGPSLAASQLLYLEDTSNSFLGFAQPLHGGQGFGAALQYFRPGSITARDAGDNVIGTFNGYSFAGTLAYGRRVFENIAVGLSAQSLESKIDDVSGRAWSGGAGAQWRPSTDVSFGAAVENIGNKLQLLDQADPLPLTGRLGGAYLWQKQVTVTVEGVFKRGSGPSGHIGFEWPNEEDQGYAFRTGFDSEYRHQLSGLAGFSAGLAVRLLGQDVSYAWVPLADLGMAHLFTVQFHWGGAERHSVLEKQQPDSDFDLNTNFSNE